MSLIRAIGSLVGGIFKPADVHYPIPINTGSIFCSDIDESNSDMGDFSGSVCDFFDSLKTVSSNTTSDNPKSVTIAFERSIGFYSLALGCDDPTKDFSNVKIKVYGSAGELLHTIDNSADGTKRNSQTFAIASQVIFFGGNSIVIEFHTTDAVGLSNVFIQKVTNTNARLQALSELTNEVENINSFRGALNVTDGLVHRAIVNEFFSRDVGPSTTLAAQAAQGDTTITVADSTGFTTGDLIKIGDDANQEVGAITITNVVGNDITIDRPIAETKAAGTVVKEIEIDMASLSGTLASPQIYELAPPTNQIWQITHLIITIADNAAMDDGTFGGIAALTNGVVIRADTSAGRVINLTNWKTNGDIRTDMFNAEYSTKAPAGEYGFATEWKFSDTAIIAELNGDNSEWLRVYIQDDITANTLMKIKAQGRIFGL